MTQFFLLFRLYNVIFSIGNVCKADASIFEISLLHDQLFKDIYFLVYFNLCVSVIYIRASKFSYCHSSINNIY